MPLVVDRFLRELNDRARFDSAPRVDVVSQPRRGGAEGFSFSVVVGVDDADRFLDTHIDDEPADAQLLLAGERQFRLRVRAHRAIDVEPRIHHAHFNEAVEPSFVDEIVNVRLANARADTRQHLVLEAVLQALHRLGEDIRTAAPFVADDLGPLDADERRDVAELSQFGGDLVGDEVAVREDLEVAVGMRCENLQQLRVHERLAADDAEEAVASLLGLGEQPVHRVEVDRLLLRGHIDPTALTAQVATVDDRDVDERRKELAPLHPAFESLNGQHPLEAKVVGELPQQALVSFEEEAFGHAKIHCGES